MKQVIAIIKPYLVEKVLEALKQAPLEACGVCEVKGYGRQKSYLDDTAAANIPWPSCPRWKSPSGSTISAWKRWCG